MKVFFANLFEEAEILSELDIAAKLFIFSILHVMEIGFSCLKD